MQETLLLPDDSVESVKGVTRRAEDWDRTKAAYSPPHLEIPLQSHEISVPQQ